MKAEQKLYETDPEFMERFEHFAYEEVVKEEGQTLDEKTRYLAILATLLGCQGLDVFKATLPEALDAGLSPVMIKETVYRLCQADDRDNRANSGRDHDAEV